MRGLRPDDMVHFAHIESDDPDNAFYTRNQGPFTLTEVDNTEHAYAGLVTGVAGK